jgi:hypothetical protein
MLQIPKLSALRATVAAAFMVDAALSRNVAMRALNLLRYKIAIISRYVKHAVDLSHKP